MFGRGGVLEDILGLEDSFWSPWPWPQRSSPWSWSLKSLKSSSIFWIVKILWSTWKNFWKTFFSGHRLKNFCEDLFFFLGNTCACVLGPWPWAFLFLASKGSVLGRVLLGLNPGFFYDFGLGLEPCVLDSISGVTHQDGLQVATTQLLKVIDYTVV